MTTYGTIPTSSGAGGTNLEYLSRAKQRIKSGLGTRRPWKQMFNLTSFNFPHSIFSEAFPRIRTNATYFRMNYAIIMLLILFISLLWQPISLIVFVLLMAAWLFFYFLRDEPLVIVNRVIGDWIVLIVLSVVTIGLLLVCGATVNVLVGVLVGFVVVVVHGVVRNIDDLCLDDEDGDEAGGYLVGDS
ncbi:PRA1 family protein F3-like [Rutidosis leptorrhynchoides]|uniref:PRA1 family protein F3-like n=1 Tax=Rutidosis leptorrhynchoides TaxID=125765 RepID=UPI003A99A479